MSVLLSDLIVAAKEFADMVGVDFVSDSTWANWANQGQEELFQIVSTTFADTFYKHVDFTATTDSNEIPLGPATDSIAPDFRMIKGLDKDPSLPSSRRPIHRFNFADRNRATAGSGLGAVYGQQDPRYRVVSRSTLVLEPQNLCAGNFRLYYVNGPLPLTLATDRNFAMTSGDGGPIQAPDGNPGFVFENASFTQADVGAVMVVAFNSPNGAWSGEYIIRAVFSPTFCSIIEGYPDPSGFTYPCAGSVEVVQSETPLMVELEPWAEYVSQVMARKALLKEESDISGIDERLLQIRNDILAAVETDMGEQDSIADVEGDDMGGAFPYMR